MIPVPFNSESEFEKKYEKNSYKASLFKYFLKKMAIKLSLAIDITDIPIYFYLYKEKVAVISRWSWWLRHTITKHESYYPGVIKKHKCFMPVSFFFIRYESYMYVS